MPPTLIKGFKMDTEDKVMLGYVWFLSLMAAMFLGHTIGYMQGEVEAREAHGYRFENTMRAFYE